MSEQTLPSAGQKSTSLLKEVLGKNEFDDRIDTQPDLDGREALRVVGRCVALIGQAKGLFTIKLFLQLGTVLWALYLPWMGKIVIDNVVLQQPFGTTDVAFPPFMDPILTLVEGRDPLGIMLVLTTIYLVGLVVLGSRAGAVKMGLAQGRDAATQAENTLNQGSSGASSLWGLFEFMVNVRLSQTLANRLRSRLFDRLTHLPMTVLDDQRTGDSVFRVLYDAPQAPDLAYRLTLVPLFMFIGAALNLYILQYSYGEVSPELVLIAWVAVPIAFAIGLPFTGALRRTNQNMRAAGSATTNAMEESMSNVAAVQSLGAGKREKERFAGRSNQTFLRERYALAVIIVAGLVLGGVFGLATIYVTILITDRIIDGSMSAGDFAALLGIFQGLLVPAGYFGLMWVKLQAHIAGVRRVFFFLDYESEENRHGEVALDDVRDGVTLDDVSFSYPDGHPALKDINLDLKVGEFVAIVGPTGSGKTTLAYLIPSLLLPSAGRVLVDGVDVTRIDVGSLRRQTSFVFQEHVLLSDSIRENLALANPDATESDMLAALETAGCMKFIDGLPDGLDTVLGRAGDTLSVGQQQRLSIARGLVRDTKILILDEPTAALDPHTENRLVRSLQSAARERLVVVIAHRLSTIRHADRIVFLEDGELKDLGSHDELMANPDSAYREFVELQTG
jgi:ABC-type multidrug transport system fused ATPase/permease subunit